jgi:hypothetical protein
MAQRRLTRDQIARIVDNDPEAIRAFEDLFRQATATGPAEVISLRSDVEGILQEPGLGSHALDLANYILDCMQNIGFAELLKTTTQAATAINTATAVTWSSIPITRNISLGSPASRIVFARKGLYGITTSFKMSSGSASKKDIYVWFRVNGTDRPDSTVIETETGANDFASLTRSFYFDLKAGDYVEAMFAVDNVGLELRATAATAFAPASPAAIATIQQLCPSS